MSGLWTTSLAQALPYWDVVQAPTGDDAHPSAAFLLLKDGSIALGFASDGLDLTGTDSETHARIAAGWTRIYANLPADAYVHADFATRAPTDALVADFAARSEGSGHPLLRRGRAEQAAAARAQRQPRCGQLHYWVGLRAALGPLLRKGWPPRRAEEGWSVIVAKCQQLWATTSELRASLASLGLAHRALNVAEVTQQLAADVGQTSAAGPMASAAATDRTNPTAVAATATAVATAMAATSCATGRTVANTAECATPPLDAPTLCERLARQGLAVAADHIRLQPQHEGEAQQQLRLYALAELPATTHPAQLHQALFEAAGKLELRCVFAHEKICQLVQRSKIEQRRKVLFALIGRYFADHRAKQAYQQHEGVLEEMALNDAHLLRTGVVICVGPGSAEAQRAAGQRLVEAMGRRGLQLACCEDEQMPAWLASLPAYGYAAPQRYRLLNANAAHLTPVFLPHPGDRQADLLVDNRYGGLSKFSIRLGDRHDASAIVVGKTGSGKTFLFSWLAKYGCLDLGGHVVVADNKGPKNSSYRPLCELLGGSYIHLKHDDNVAFNPFPPANEVHDASGKFDPSKVEGLESILFMMTEDPASQLHPDYARNVVRRIVYALYADGNAVTRPLVLRDAVAVARQLDLPSDALRRTAQTMAQRLQLWCEDPVRGRLFNAPQTLVTDNRLTVFDFHGFTRDKFLAAVLISVLSQRIEAKMNHLAKDTPKLFAFDEAWAMFDGSAEATNLLNRLYRTARSYGACVYTLTQSYHDITSSAAAQGIMANVGLTYLLRHQDGHADAAAYFGLNRAQLDLFRSLQMVPGAYAESLLIDAHAGRTRVLRYRPTPFDLWCDTSRPQDVALREQAMRATNLPLQEIIALLARLCPGGAPSGAANQQRVLADLAQQGDQRMAS